MSAFRWRTCLSLIGACSLLGAPAHADVNGFETFAPVNTNGGVQSVGFRETKSLLVLTDGERQESASSFAATPQRIAAFDASFTYRLVKPGDNPGDGIAFVVQNDPRKLTALGDHGNSVGYSGDGAILHSVAVRFGVYSTSGEGVSTNASNTSFDDTEPVDLRSGHPIHVELHYDGAVLSETLKDETTGDVFTGEHEADIPAAVGSGTALVGITGASGDSTAVQTVANFRFTELPPVPASHRRHIPHPLRAYNSLDSYVDPIIGTAGGGNTYPGAVAPFGMVQFSPDTQGTGIGYDHGRGKIDGFSMTHMSGVGCDDFGDVFLTATTGPVATLIDDYRSSYTHRQESASPGYYQVKLLRPDVNVELTATEHAGLARFTFPAGKAANILVPISHTLTYTKGAQLKIVGDHTVEGKVSSQSFCGARSFYTVYFVMRLDKPFATFGTFAGAVRSDGNREATGREQEAGIGAYLSYPADGPRTVTARIGISFVDLAGARANLDREAGTQSFDTIRKQTAAAWEKNLHVLEAKGGTDDQRSVFYTALYHCLLMPNIFNDVDGRYLGFDGQIHTVAPGHAIYANYSGWDIYRDEAPLLALIQPHRMADMCQSIALMNEQGGWIDRWPQANTYTNVMCGSPLTSVVATAWNYGIRGFDIQSAYAGMFKDATQAPPGGTPYYGQSNIAWMDKIGYIPDDKEGYGSVSQTEEDCYSYAALASVAASLGKNDDATMLRKRALNYRNVFDPETHFLRPRNADGTWSSPFDGSQEKGYVEGSAWHYRWLAPQDAAGLIRLFGGDEAFNRELDAFFAYPIVGWTDRYYNPYNETDLEAAFLYDYSGAPWKTQQTVRKVLGEVYTTKPDGIPGNDDCGTMSAWFVFAAMGLYPTDPARPAFELCSPLFPSVTIHLEAPYTGKTFTIRAPDASTANAYIQSAALNGSGWGSPWISQKAVADGGTLTFGLGAQPVKTWGAQSAQRPPSL